MMEDTVKQQDDMSAEDVLEDATEMPEPEALSEESGENDPLNALKAENAELKDKVLRAMAEMENVRRRADREKADAAKFGVSSLAKNLLIVADNLKRALESVPADAKKDNDQMANLVTGVEATRSELMKAFQAMGITQIDAQLGQAFDPNRHEVMFEGPSDQYAGGAIMQVLEDGYMIHDRLLRPARVGVVKKGAGMGDAVNVEA